MGAGEHGHSSITDSDARLYIRATVLLLNLLLRVAVEIGQLAYCILLRFNIIASTKVKLN